MLQFPLLKRIMDMMVISPREAEVISEVPEVREVDTDISPIQLSMVTPSITTIMASMVVLSEVTLEDLLLWVGRGRLPLLLSLLPQTRGHNSSGECCWEIKILYRKLEKIYFGSMDIANCIRLLFRVWKYTFSVVHSKADNFFWWTKANYWQWDFWTFR